MSDSINQQQHAAAAAARRRNKMRISLATAPPHSRGGSSSRPNPRKHSTTRWKRRSTRRTNAVGERFLCWATSSSDDDDVDDGGRGEKGGRYHPLAHVLAGRSPSRSTSTSSSSDGGTLSPSFRHFAESGNEEGATTTVTIAFLLPEAQQRRSRDGETGNRRHNKQPARYRRRDGAADQEVPEGERAEMLCLVSTDERTGPQQPSPRRRRRRRGQRTGAPRRPTDEADVEESRVEEDVEVDYGSTSDEFSDVSDSDVSESEGGATSSYSLSDSDDDDVLLVSEIRDVTHRGGGSTQPSSRRGGGGGGGGGGEHDAGTTRRGNRKRPDRLVMPPAAAVHPPNREASVASSSCGSSSQAIGDVPPQSLKLSPSRRTSVRGSRLSTPTKAMTSPCSAMPFPATISPSGGLRLPSGQDWFPCAPTSTLHHPPSDHLQRAGRAAAAVGAGPHMDDGPAPPADRGPAAVVMLPAGANYCYDSVGHDGYEAGQRTSLTSRNGAAAAAGGGSLVGGGGSKQRSAKKGCDERLPTKTTSKRLATVVSVDRMTPAVQDNVTTNTNRTNRDAARGRESVAAAVRTLTQSRRVRSQPHERRRRRQHQPLTVNSSKTIQQRRRSATTLPPTYLRSPRLLPVAAPSVIAPLFVPLPRSLPAQMVIDAEELLGDLAITT